MNKAFEDVRNFMVACGQIPPDTVLQEESELSKLYRKLIEEEYEEFQEAIQQKDNTEVLDACFDQIWVILGYMYSRGWDVDASWNEGAKSNLSKIDSETGKVLKRSDGKIQKPEGWKPPNFHQFVK